MLASSSKRSLINLAFSARLRPSAVSLSFHSTMCLNMLLLSWSEGINQVLDLARPGETPEERIAIGAHEARRHVQFPARERLVALGIRNAAPDQVNRHAVGIH